MMLLPNRFAAGLVMLCGQPVHRIAATRFDRVTLRNDSATISPWLFRYVRGEHINALHLAEELRLHGAPPLVGRTGAWQQLVRELDPAILADAIGISPTTAIKHGERVGTSYLHYAGSRAASLSVSMPRPPSDSFSTMPATRSRPGRLSKSTARTGRP